MKPNNADRLLSLEEKSRGLSRRIEHQESQRLAETVPPVSIRLAQSWTENEEDYPTGGDALLYPFVFCNVTSGAEPTWTKRSADKQGDALWPQKRFLPRETKIAVGEDRNGTYFIVQAYTGATLCDCQLADDLAVGTGNVDVDNVVGLDGYAPELTEGKLNVENRFGFAGSENYKALIQWDDRAQKWFLLQMKCLPES